MTEPVEPGLTGTQKVAVVLMNMDSQRAAGVLKQFSEHEAEEIAAEIVRLRRVDSVVAEKTLSEFHELTVRSAALARGGRDFAVGLLEASFGAERAAGVMNRVASSMAGKAFEFLEQTEPAPGRSPCSTASCRRPSRSCSPTCARSMPPRCIAGLDETLRTDVAQLHRHHGHRDPGGRARSSPTPCGSGPAPSCRSRDTVEVVGGVQPLVDIINRADVATERALLEALDERDPELAEEVRSRMLTFADIVKLETHATCSRCCAASTPACSRWP